MNRVVYQEQVDRKIRSNIQIDIKSFTYLKEVEKKWCSKHESSFGLKNGLQRKEKLFSLENFQGVQSLSSWRSCQINAMEVTIK